MKTTVCHRLLMVALVMAMSGVRAFAFDGSSARTLVGNFYANLAIIAGEKFDAEGNPKGPSVQAKIKNIGLCSTENIKLPCEFYNFGFEAKDPFLGASTYLTRMQKFADKYDVKFNSSIINVVEIEEIKAAKTEVTNFYEVYVKKSISANGKSVTYTDTVMVYATKGTIQNIYNNTGGHVRLTAGTGHSAVSAGGTQVGGNQTGGSQIGGSEGTTTAADTEDFVMNMRAEAARMYARKQYDEAYRMYEEIIKRSPKEGDAYYRLGLMAYHNKGCKNVFKSGKERRKKAYQYMQNAEQYGNTEISTYAKRVLYYMTNGNV